MCVCVLKAYAGLSLPFSNSILWKVEWVSWWVLLVRITEQVQLGFILPPSRTILSTESSCSRLQPQAAHCREVHSFWRKLALVQHTGSSDKPANLEFSIRTDIFLTEVPKPQLMMMLICALLYLRVLFYSLFCNRFMKNSPTPRDPSETSADAESRSDLGLRKFMEASGGWSVYEWCFLKNQEDEQCWQAWDKEDRGTRILRGTC